MKNDLLFVDVAVYKMYISSEVLISMFQEYFGEENEGCLLNLLFFKSRFH